MRVSLVDRVQKLLRNTNVGRFVSRSLLTTALIASPALAQRVLSPEEVDKLGLIAPSEQSYKSSGVSSATSSGKPPKKRSDYTRLSEEDLWGLHEMGALSGTDVRAILKRKRLLRSKSGEGSQPKTNRDTQYNFGQDYSIILRERFDENRAVYEVDIRVNSSAQDTFSHIRDVSVMIDGASVLENQVIMAYNTTRRSSSGQLIGREYKYDLIDVSYMGFKLFVPKLGKMVAKIENMINNADKFFEELDNIRGNDVYPRYVRGSSRLFVPLDEVLNQDIGNFTLDTVNRVRLIIPVEGNPNSRLFVSFRTGQRISKATASIAMAAEIMEDRKRWFKYEQRKGHLTTSKDTQKSLGQSLVAENFLNSLISGDVNGVRKITADPTYRMLERKGEIDVIRNKSGTKIRYIGILKTEEGVMDEGGRAAGYVKRFYDIKDGDFSRVRLEIEEDGWKELFDVYLARIGGNWKVYFFNQDNEVYRKELEREMLGISKEGVEVCIPWYHCSEPYSDFTYGGTKGATKRGVCRYEFFEYRLRRGWKPLISFNAKENLSSQEVHNLWEKHDLGRFEGASLGYILSSMAD